MSSQLLYYGSFVSYLVYKGRKANEADWLRQQEAGRVMLGSERAVDGLKGSRWQ